MAKTKSKGFTDQEKALLRKQGCDPRFWEPVQVAAQSMIIRNRFTGEVKTVYKK